MRRRDSLALSAVRPLRGMSMCHPLFHHEGARIDRAQAHRTRKALDGPIRFTEPQAH